MTLPDLIRSGWLLLMLTTALLGMVNSAVAQDTGKRVALVIGNGSYQRWEPLSNPGNDAQLIARVLREDLGFEVTLLRDTNRVALIDAIEAFERHASRADAAVFYFSGHGMQDNLRKNYLIPIDASIQGDASIRAHGVEADVVVESLSRAAARVSLVVLDACRNNPFLTGRRGGGRGLARMEIDTKVDNELLIAFATRDGEIAKDGEGNPNSPYAQALAAQLSRAGQQPIRLVLDNVREQVRQMTGDTQRPVQFGEMRSTTYLTVRDIAPRPGRQDTALGGAQVPNMADTAALAMRKLEMEREFWSVIREKSEPHYFLEYQLRFPDGQFAELARTKAGVAVRTKSGCALREHNLPTIGVEVEWSGDCRDGLAHGAGTKTYFQSGAKSIAWQGSMNRGVPFGRWIGEHFRTSENGPKSTEFLFDRNGELSSMQSFTLNNGVTYVGSTNATKTAPFGKPHGFGKMLYRDGATYEGEWQDGKRNGKGELVYPRRTSDVGISSYAGDFKDDSSTGTATVIWSNGAKYSGSLVNARPHGFGRMMYADGAIYEGEWQNGKRHGRGQGVFPKSTSSIAPLSHSGEFRDDVLHGTGTFIWANGAKYTGGWVNGQRTGFGELIRPDGSQISGEFLNGQCVTSCRDSARRTR